MKPTVRRVLLVIAAVVFLAGVAYAINMGFKIVYQMDTQPQSEGGWNTIALPYTPKDGLVDAKDLIDNINEQAGSNVVVQIARWLPDAAVWSGYTGTSGVAFPLQPGEGYMVQLTSEVDYRIVGSHDPNVTIALLDLEEASGYSCVSLPYHAVATDAKELIDEINAQAGANVVVQVARYIRSAGGWASYTGTSGVAFPLERGKAYMVHVTDTTYYRPEHY